MIKEQSDSHSRLTLCCNVKHPQLLFSEERITKLDPKLVTVYVVILRVPPSTKAVFMADHLIQN